MQRRVVRAGELGEPDAVGERGVRRHGEPQPHLQIDGRRPPALRRECVRQVGVVGRHPALLSARCALQQRRGDLPSLRTLIGGHGQQQLAAVSQCGADQGPAGSDVATRVLSGHRAEVRPAPLLDVAAEQVLLAEQPVQLLVSRRSVADLQALAD
jgi:hypothetical protein